MATEAEGWVYPSVPRLVLESHPSNCCFAGSRQASHEWYNPARMIASWSLSLPRSGFGTWQCAFVLGAKGPLKCPNKGLAYGSTFGRCNFICIPQSILTLCSPDAGDDAYILANDVHVPTL